MTKLRFGLCCAFSEQPIRFRTTTAASLARISRPEALQKLSDLCLLNSQALRASLEFCATHGIGCFRVNSQILPLKTHPDIAYEVDVLPDATEIRRGFTECRDYSKQHQLRTCFHPDQFVVLNSQRPDVVKKSIDELEYQAEIAEWIGADVINIHGGGAYGNKSQALNDFARTLDRLSTKVRSRLTIENDDKLFTPEDLIPLCRTTGIPLVYDVHHHRCNPDSYSLEQSTDLAIETWDREPLFHISSPFEGWSGPKPERHHDFINVSDFPRDWLNRKLTVEVEAKAKELAVLRLIESLELQ